MTDGPTLASFFANWDIFRDAVFAGMAAGALLGFLGVQIVLRRMVFASSAIAQVAALGVALSFWVPALVDPAGHAARHASDPSAHIVPFIYEPVLWALAASLLATFAFIANPVRLHLTRESVLGVVFLIGGAGTVIIGDRIKQESNDLGAILFGSAVVVQRTDLILIVVAMVALLGVHVFRMRALMFAAFDPVGARVQGLPVGKLNTFVFVAVGVAVALSTRALGALPVFAFSVLPAMAALALTERLGLVFALSAIIGALSGGAGYLVSFRGDLPVGATQTAVALALFVLALVRRAVTRALSRSARTGTTSP